MIPASREARPTVLVVDDAAANLELLAEILDGAYEVSIAISGQQALDVLQRGNLPDLILLDVMMPDMDGYAVNQAIKASAQSRDIPVIFVTAMSDPVSESRALAAGAVDFIHKPINRDVVLARVRLHLGLVSQRRELESLNDRLAGSLAQIKKAHDELKVFATVIEQSPTAIVITDAEGGIEYVNPFFERNAGYALHEVKGHNPFSEASGQTDERIQGVLWASLSDGESWSGELVNRSKSGRLYREEVHIAPVRDDHGRTSHYVSVQMDITARHEAEQLVAQARQRELEISAAIQQQLLFGELPASSHGFEIGCFTEASQVVDGDFYTFTSLGNRCFEILTGDAMGKGISAALMGASVKNAYREAFNDLMIQAPQNGLPSPAQLVNAVHDRVSPHLIELGVFVTLCLMRFDATTGELTWVNAGHSPTLLATQAGEVSELLGDNLPLGILQQEVYEQQITRIAEGDAVLMFSDGLSEATDAQQEQFGIERIKAIVQAAQQQSLSPLALLDKLKQDVSSFVDQGQVNDDLTVLAIRATKY